jgi:hypothetical protein
VQLPNGLTVTRVAPARRQDKAGPSRDADPPAQDEAAENRVKDLVQLHTREQVTGSRYTGNEGEATLTEKAYTVIATLRGGRQQTLLSPQADPEPSLYIEQLIEESLGIPDIFVKGEYRP